MALVSGYVAYLAGVHDPGNAVQPVPIKFLHACRIDPSFCGNLMLPLMKSVRLDKIDPCLFKMGFEALRRGWLTRIV